VNFTLSEEQDELRRTVRSFLDQKSPESEVRRLMETVDGYDPAVWKQMGAELGLQGLVIPEDLGGSGYTFVELGIVLQEMGRRLLCAPFLSTAVMATQTLLRAGDTEAQRTHLPGIADGQTIATVAFAEGAGGWDDAAVSTTARRDGDQWRLTGTKSFVLDGHIADLLLVTARTEAGVSLFAVAAHADGMTRTPLVTLDQTRKQAIVVLEDTPADLVGSEGGGGSVVRKVIDMTAVALAAEQAGGAQFVLDMAVQYAKDRVQFGRPIGSFQAIKHKCADLLLEVESVTAAAQYAAWCAAEDNDELPVIAALVKAYCSDAYFHATTENIQIHGGIGFTWEHPAHLYFKRAKSTELLFGDSPHWREQLALRIGV
jgi:alkylation response protein AidB-like acyl-CoA dehydrogenase